jgi:methyl-accepting chemotaxis protein/methyl-accepting chemotaxis protein-1 (serine sensor receptor)
VSRFGVTKKIWLSCAVFVAGYALSTLLGQLQSSSLESRLERTARALFPAAQKAQAAEAAFQRTTKLYRDAVMTEDGAALDQAKEESDRTLDGLRAVAGLKGLSPEFSGSVNDLLSSLSDLVGQSDRTYRRVIVSKNNDGSTQSALQDIAGRTDRARDALARLVTQASGDLSTEVDTAARDSAQQRWISLGVFFATLVLAAGLVNVTVRRAIVRPLGQVTSQLSDTAQKVASAATQLSSVSQALARSSSDQAHELEATSASGDKANATARRNAEGAAKAKGLMQDAGSNFTSIDEAHRQLVSAMDEISQSSGRISKIIKVIDDIAFQTNILALNAAVEAARAGESGAGFAVVADEVRNLAQRSAKAAQDTSGLIEESVSRSGAGRTRLENVTVLLETNRTIAGQVNSLIEEISAASQDQARDMACLSASVCKTSQTTQMTSEHAQRSADVVEDLSAQSQALNAIVDSLGDVIGR